MRRGASNCWQKGKSQVPRFFYFLIVCYGKKNKTYKANKDWYSNNDDDFSKISVQFCLNQIRKWAKALAEKKAEETNQGKKLGYLKNLKETCRDQVMEANVSEELKQSLDNILNNVGIAWNSQIKA